MSLPYCILTVVQCNIVHPMYSLLKNMLRIKSALLQLTISKQFENNLMPRGFFSDFRLHIIQVQYVEVQLF